MKNSTDTELQQHKVQKKGRVKSRITFKLVNAIAMSIVEMSSEYGTGYDAQEIPVV